MERDLEQRMRELETFVNNIPHMAWLKDAGSNFLIANKAFVDAVGMSPEYLKSHTCAVCFGEEAAKKFKADDRRVMEGKKQITLEEKIVDKDGKEIYLETTKSPIFNDVGDAVGTVGIAIDITERKKVEEALIESENRYKVSFDNSRDAINVFSPDGRILAVNNKLIELSGYYREELLSMKLLDIFPEASSSATKERMGMMKQGKEVPVFETYLLTKKKEKVPVEIGVTRLNNCFGQKVVIQGNIRDITERKEAEEELGKYRHKLEELVEERTEELKKELSERKRVEKSLQESEGKFRSILKSMDDLVFVLDKDNRYVSYYAPENKLYVKPEVFLGKKYSEVMPDFMDELFNNALIEVKKNKIAEFEYQLEVPDGLHWYSTKLSPIMEGDEYIGLVAVARDITERKKTEEALRKSEQKCRNVFESVNDGIFTMDLNGTYTEVNKRVLEMYGLKSADEIIGKSGFEFVAPQDIEKAREGMEKVLEGEAVAHQEYNALRVDGSEITIEVTGSLLKDESGNPIGITGIARDITERRRAEEGLRKTERLESLGFLAGGIAHDFNNLLSGIFGQIELAMVNRTSEQKVLQSLERALQAMNRARDLTHQLLTFSSGGAPVKKLISVEDDLRQSVTFALSGSNVHPVYSIDKNLLPAEADQSQINQVINNILLNARQAMPEGGTIEIEAKNFDVKIEKDLPLKQGRYVQIAIKDHGIGMPAEILEKIFDPFYTTKQTGSGLGLSICYSIVKKHDGHITVESKPGSGSIFTIYLPASEEEFQREPEKQYELLEGKGKILIMDDEPIVCELLAGELDLLGYETVVTQNGEEAVLEYKKELESGTKFDAVILDLTIPGGNGGKEVVKELQNINPDVKAVVSSGYSENPVIADPVKYGFRNAIQKPFKMEVLSQVLYDLVNE